MTDPNVSTMPGAVGAPSARLEPDAISVAQDTLIGLADTGPTVTISFVLVGLIVTSAYAAPTVLAITAIPMLIIANAYRRLNLWNANCGASFEWVGRAINPYLGFITGWLMLAGTLFGSLTPVTAIGPNILAVFNQPANGMWPNVLIASVIVLIMLAISIVGIRISARTQVAIAVVEYAILIVFAVWGLTWMLGHHAGTVPITASWFSLHGINGKGVLVAGFLTTVFMYSGWDGTIYVNEEVQHRRANPGRAAMIAVAVAGVLFILAQVAFQGLTSFKNLNNNSTAPLTYIGQLLSGSKVGGDVFAFAVALSVIAATGVGIVLSARIAYGIASHRALPAPLANISPRFSTPIVATVSAGVILLALAWVYLLTSSVQATFGYVLNNTGILYATFYVLTALSAIVYYRRRVMSNLTDAITLGVLPIAAIAFLGYVAVKSILGAPAAQNYSLLGFLVAGVILLFVARFVLRSPFFSIKRESWSPEEASDSSRPRHAR
ncbi:MAG TPA: APC family permease [Streptosporangiaceae bacterium]|nr:APC family permease [Streptosporangiaceae bacterium]